MNTIGIIAEGPTDQIVIQNILIGYFKEDVSSHVRFLQPQYDETDKHKNDALGGGWSNVFNYCKSSRFTEAFEQNDFIIVQIDTDVCEQVNFDVKRKHLDGTEKTVEELIVSVIDKFRDEISRSFRTEVYESVKDRIIFAVCVDEIECWLLPIYHTDKRKAATNNCIHKLNEVITEKLGFYINKADKSNMGREYFKLSKPYTKKVLHEVYKENPSLKYFIDRLESVFG